MKPSEIVKINHVINEKSNIKFIRSTKIFRGIVTAELRQIWLTHMQYKNMKDVILTCLVETKQGEEVHAHSLFVFTRELRFPCLANPPAHVLSAVFINAYAKLSFPCVCWVVIWIVLNQAIIYSALSTARQKCNTEMWATWKWLFLQKIWELLLKVTVLFNGILIRGVCKLKTTFVC